MWRYCSGVPLFVTVSLQTEDMRRRQREREQWGWGVGVAARGRRMWRKGWIMWLRIMSKKLHKAFSQITYQLGGWHYPWSISSVLDPVPLSFRSASTRAPTHPRACRQPQHPISSYQNQPMSSSLSHFVHLFLLLSPILSSLVFKVISQVSSACAALANMDGPAPYLQTDVWRSISITTVRRHPMNINGKALGFLCSAFVLPGYSTQTWQQGPLYKLLDTSLLTLSSQVILARLNTNTWWQTSDSLMLPIDINDNNELIQIRHVWRCCAVSVWGFFILIDIFVPF